MSLFNRDQATIVAPSTASGVGAIGVLRVSGRRALEISRRIASFLPEEVESHRVYYGVLRHPSTHEVLDEVLLTYFGFGRSFTGESTVEISTHGNPVVMDRVMRALVEFGARPALPGEFTYRAFLSGRIDLMQAEGVLDVIESRSEAASRAALRQLGGGLSQRVQHIEDSLIWVQAHLEANIDFAQEDIEIASAKLLIERLENALEVTEGLLSSFEGGRVLREGLKVALVGAPNTGKSSLLNALMGEELAIVADVAGTTRDPVVGDLRLAGVDLRVVDTAGLRSTDDLIEGLGIDRTWREAQKSDVILYVADARDPEFLPGLEKLVGGSRKVGAIVFNKADLVDVGSTSFETRQTSLDSRPAFWVSAKFEQGLDLLKNWLGNEVHRMAEGEGVVLINARHFENLSTVKRHLVDAIRLLRDGASPEFVASEVHVAVREIHALQGKIFDDEVMDRVFKEFCLGK